MPKGLVFGNGFLGSRIAAELGYQLIGREEVNPLNFNDLGVFLDSKRPDVAINAVGKTGGPGEIGVDWCETHREESFRSNVSAAINISSACSDREIYFVHFGSGCIYEGDNGGRGFKEEDEPNFYGPQFYAKTKILAEKALLELPGLILRIRMPIDDRPSPRNLITKLSNYPKVITAPNSATTIPHMVPALRTMIEKRMAGVYNFVNPGTISASEIMYLYQEIVDPQHSFQPMDLAELDSITKARRSNCYLNTNKLFSQGIVLPQIHDAVVDCLSIYRRNRK